MENVIVQLLETVKKKNIQAYKDFQDAFKVGFCEKGDHLISVGQVCKKLFLLKSGVVKHFRNTNEGNEQIIWFGFEGDIVSVTKSFVKQEPSQEGLLALEDCHYISMHRDTCYELSKKYHEIETFYRELLEHYCIEADERLYFQLAFSAKQKYEHILKYYPKFIQEIPQKELSSFLGITRETLSRIRKFS